MINLVITLLFVCLVCWLVNYIVNSLQLPPPLRNVVLVVFAVLVLVYLIQLLLGVGPMDWHVGRWN